MFELLCLEGQQAGLSWATVLKKRIAYKRAFHDFDVTAVAKMTDDDTQKVPFWSWALSFSSFEHSSRFPRLTSWHLI
jgi:hypothetical protein